MSICRFSLIAVAVLGTLAGILPAPALAAAPVEQCSSAFRVAQRSFRGLDARNTYVWVDGIDTTQRPYAPFQVVVAIGTAYPPFKADSGTLDRAAFDAVMKSAYGVTRVNATVSDAVLKKGPVVLPFTSAKQAFTLKIVSVSPGAAVSLQLCR